MPEMRTGNHTHLQTIDRRIDMLTIVDLHQEEELSSSSMSKVAGGADIDAYLDCAGPRDQLSDGLMAAANAFGAAGYWDAAVSLSQQAVAVAGTPCPM
jgi:hypothetical protein